MGGRSAAPRRGELEQRLCREKNLYIFFQTFFFLFFKQKYGKVDPLTFQTYYFQPKKIHRKKKIQKNGKADPLASETEKTLNTIYFILLSTLTLLTRYQC